MMQKKF